MGRGSLEMEMEKYPEFRQAFKEVDRELDERISELVAEKAKLTD